MRVRSLVVSAALVSCNGALQAPPRRVAVRRTPVFRAAPATIPPEPGFAPAAAPPPGRPLPPGIPQPAHATCALDARTIVAHLRLSADGALFATVAQGPLALVIGPGKSTQAELDDGRIRLRAFVDVRQIVVHPRRALRFGGFVIPGPSAGFALLSAKDDALRVEYRLQPHAELRVSPSTLRASVACEDVATDFAPSRPWDDGGWSGAESARLAPARVIALSERAGGRAVATVVAPGSYPVHVIERHGSRARIVIPDGADVLIGWVAASALLPPALALGAIGTVGHGAGTGTGQGFGAFTSVRCAHALALIGEIGRVRRTVGEVRAGTSLIPGTPRDGLVPVGLRVHFLDLAPHAELLVDEAQLADCARRHPPSLPEHTPSGRP